MRKIIQITSSCCSDMNGSDIYFLSALCNDGTVWEYMHTTNSWYQLSNIPQSANEEDEHPIISDCMAQPGDYPND